MPSAFVSVPVEDVLTCGSLPSHLIFLERQRSLACAIRPDEWALVLMIFLLFIQSASKTRMFLDAERAEDGTRRERERGDKRRSGTRTVSRRASCAMQATLL